jgi:hypothetical protein
MSSRLPKMLLMLPLCAAFASIQTESVLAQNPHDPDCYNKCIRNYACGPEYPRGPNDISCKVYGKGCHEHCGGR